MNAEFTELLLSSLDKLYSYAITYGRTNYMLGVYCALKMFSHKWLLMLKCSTTHPRSTTSSLVHPILLQLCALKAPYIKVLGTVLFKIASRTDPSIKSTIKPMLCVSRRFNYFPDNLASVPFHRLILNFLLFLIRKQSAGGTPRPRREH